MNNAFIVWQDEITRLWHPVARVSKNKDGYELVYTKGAKQDRFKPFVNMNNLRQRYKSSELFSFFQNRILPPSRPEFKKVITWLNLSEKDFNPLEYLAISGGSRNTDNFMVVPLPERNNDMYRIDFLINGVRYINGDALDEIYKIKQGDKIDFHFEDSNHHDSSAIALYRKNKRIGYCPRYLAEDFKRLLGSDKLQDKKFSAVKINPEAPYQYKILCRLETKWPEDFTPFLSEEYRDLS